MMSFRHVFSFFHVYGTFKPSLTYWHSNFQPHDKTDSDEFGIIFMNETIAWAVLPLDRPIIRYCLEALAWAMRAPNEPPCQHVIVGSHKLPGEILTHLLEWILQSY
jgi:hypothetical protein